MYTADEIDDETLADAERECLTRPEDCAMWDDRLYTTHGPVLSWAERGDGVLAESNYLTVLDHLRGVAVSEDDYVVDATMAHWLVGSLRQLFVRVRDEHTGEYTRVFREAVAISLNLREHYPVFDEDDYFEREWREHQAAVDDALDYVRREDDPDDVVELFLERSGDLYEGEGYVDTDRAERLYLACRDEYYTRLGHEYLRAQVPGQLAALSERNAP